jgi:AcrR family transcriptional regulator
VESSQKREAVMQAALELVGEHGFHGSPMALIAERAGVAAGTIYRFFDSKDTLIKEIHHALEAEILAALTAGYPAALPARDRFLHIGRNLVRYFIASPLNFRFLEQYHFSPYGVASRRDKFFGRKDSNLIGELFEDAGNQGLIKDLPPPILFALAFGPLGDVCRDHILEFIVLDDRLIEQTVVACLDALRR